MENGVDGVSGRENLLETPAAVSVRLVDEDLAVLFVSIDDVEQAAGDANAAQLLQRRIRAARRQELWLGMLMPAVVVDQDVVYAAGPPMKADVPHCRFSLKACFRSTCGAVIHASMINLAQQRQEMRTTFFACSPFRPWTPSKLT
ncbi:MAG TPA: hypothetical protein VE871_18935 [Longimicrobium sp.]|nr:hypothetical protein [Longimicrobium sp.]